MKFYIKISALGGVGTVHQDTYEHIWTVESVHFIYNSYSAFKTNFDRDDDGGPGYFMMYDDAEGGWFLRKDFAEAYGFMEGPWSDILLTPTVED
jgi:hypothetical protein